MSGSLSAICRTRFTLTASATPGATSYASTNPDLVRAYREGRAPKPGWNPRCPNKVRYEMLTRLGY